MPEFKIEEIGNYAANKIGMDQSLVRSEAEKQQIAQEANAIGEQQAAQGQDPTQGLSEPPPVEAA